MYYYTDLNCKNINKNKTFKMEKVKQGKNKNNLSGKKWNLGLVSVKVILMVKLKKKNNKYKKKKKELNYSWIENKKLKAKKDYLFKKLKLKQEVSSIGSKEYSE